MEVSVHNSILSELVTSYPSLPIEQEIRECQNSLEDSNSIEELEINLQRELTRISSVKEIERLRVKYNTPTKR